MPGPVPKRSDARRNRNQKPGPALVKAPSGVNEGDKLSWPNAGSHWVPTAKRWYLSLRNSGQAQFYEPSDVAQAVYCAELMTMVLSGQLGTAGFAPVVNAIMEQLLTSEGARRRARLELQRGDPGPDAGQVDQLAKYRAAAARRGA